MKATLEIQNFGARQNGCFPALTVAGREIQMPEKASEMEAFLAHTSMALANDAVDNAFCQDRQLGCAWQWPPHTTGHTSIEIPAIRQSFHLFSSKEVSRDMWVL